MSWRFVIPGASQNAHLVTIRQTDDERQGQKANLRGENNIDADDKLI